MRGTLVAVVLVGGCAYDPRAATPSTTDGATSDALASDAATDGMPIDAAFACPIGYTLRAPNSCHRAGASALTWDLAEADCELAGAHLVIVDDSFENSALPADVWIGLSERVTGIRWLRHGRADRRRRSMHHDPRRRLARRQLHRAQELRLRVR